MAKSNETKYAETKAIFDHVQQDVHYKEASVGRFVLGPPNFETTLEAGRLIDAIRGGDTALTGWSRERKASLANDYHHLLHELGRAHIAWSHQRRELDVLVSELRELRKARNEEIE